jgi:hypothetical protein
VQPSAAGAIMSRRGCNAVVIPSDPIAFATASATLLAAGILAALVPARRVGMMEPLIALREQ